MKLSVIIPVYNERSTIEEIVRKVSAVPIEKEVIIVDHGSTDGTADIIRNGGIPLTPEVSSSTEARCSRPAVGSDSTILSCGAHHIR